MPLPVVPSLSNMVELGLQDMLHAKSRRDFEKAFDGFIADDASITMNGRPVARSHYMEHLWKDQMRERSADVRFKEVVDVPNDPRALVQTGEVGVFYEATIRAQQNVEHNIIRASVNMVVDKKGDKGLDDLEGRMVTAVNQVSTVRGVVGVIERAQ